MTFVNSTVYPTDMVLIQKINCTNAQFAQFDNISDIYRGYVLYLNGISVLNNGDQIAMQVSTDGISWGANQQTYQNASSAGGFSSVGNSSTLYQLVNTASGFATNYKSNGMVYFLSPSVSNGIDKLFNWQMVAAYTAPQINIFDGGGNSANIVNHIRIFGWNGAAVTGIYGSFSLYGIIGI